MDRRLRPRKPLEKENIQPAKRTRRALSPIEQTVRTAIGEKNILPGKRARRAFSTIEREPANQSKKKIDFQNVQTQTDTNCCLASTNVQLVRELIAQNNLIQQKDQKYIKMLERFYLEKTQLTAENEEQNLEIARLNARIHKMESEPLVHIDCNGKFTG